MRVGQKVVQQKDHVVFTKWHDKRDVSIISTNNYLTHKNYCSPLAVDVHRHNQEVAKPAEVVMYNKHMGGVDLVDQLLQYYLVDRSSCKF